MQEEKLQDSHPDPAKPRVPKPVKYFVLGWGSVIGLLAIVAYIVDVMNQ